MKERGNLGNHGMNAPCPASRQHWELCLHAESAAWAAPGRSLLGAASQGCEAALGRAGADADAAVCGREESHGLRYQPREPGFCCTVT